LLKPVATLGIAAAGLFGFFHYITVGPNRAEDEHEAEEEVTK
ncbi:MAG: formate dehydrogenase subunit beta, partial [Azospira oryzae]